MKNILLSFILIMFFAVTAFAQKTTVHRNKDGVVVRITSNDPTKNVRIDKNKVEVQKIKRTVVVKKPLNNSVEKQETIAENSKSNSEPYTPFYEVRYVDFDGNERESSTNENTTTNSSSLFNYDNISSSYNTNYQTESKNPQEESKNKYGVLGSRASTNIHGDIIYKDKYGSTTGSASTNIHGDVIYKDKYGSTIGSASTNIHGDIIYKDEYGSTTGSASTNIHGDVIYKDKYGSTIGSASTNIHGDVIYKDKYGSTIGSASTNIHGDVIYKDKYGVVTDNILNMMK